MAKKKIKNIGYMIIAADGTPLVWDPVDNRFWFGNWNGRCSVFSTYKIAYARLRTFRNHLDTFKHPGEVWAKFDGSKITKIAPILVQ